MLKKLEKVIEQVIGGDAVIHKQFNEFYTAMIDCKIELFFYFETENQIKIKEASYINSEGWFDFTESEIQEIEEEINNLLLK